MITITHSWT